MTPADAERYRRKAEECHANARTVTDDADRAAWLRRAEVWTELARSANRDGTAPGNAEEEIKKRAYEIWERDGRPKGKEDEFWQQAEQELRNENKSSPHPHARHESGTFLNLTQSAPIFLPKPQLGGRQS